MLPRSAAKPGESGSSRRHRGAHGRPVQYFSCTRCATAATRRPPRRRRPQLDVVRLREGPAVELVDFCRRRPAPTGASRSCAASRRPAAPIVRDLVPPRPQARSPARPARRNPSREALSAPRPGRVQQLTTAAVGGMPSLSTEGCMSRFLMQPRTDTRHDGGLAITSALWEWDVTTDQLRTTTAELCALQRSAMDTSDKWFALDTRRGPIWGSRIASSNLASPTR
ncbi:MAG: hypothetical protein K0S14_58 [Thermomicrobiales bacterium]|jgi:hypothetical protein|nr:hypothetical protein [Thermomicrobiales bacterium]